MDKLKLKALRVNAGLTQEQAAKAIGVNRMTVANWEAEKSWPDLKKLGKLAEIYGCTLDDIFLPSN